MYVRIAGNQFYKNEDGKKTEDINPLTLCERLDNSTLTPLMLDIENRLFKDKPYCIDKKYNYTIQGWDKESVRKSVSIDISKCTNTST